MTDQVLRSLLLAVRRAAGHIRLYGSEHELTEQAVDDVAEAANALIDLADESTLTILDDTLYVDRTPATAVSVAFNGFIRSLKQAGVETIVFQAPVRHEDARSLAGFVAGSGTPPSGSITLNEGTWSRIDMKASPTDGLRQAYTSSLSALRTLGDAVGKGSPVELTEATVAVTSLLEEVVAQPEAGLLLTTVKSHHEYTFYHSVNTSIMAIALGRLVGLQQDDLLVLGLGALLHDIGKVGVPATILQHPGRLGPEDWVEIKRHPVIGAEMIFAAAAPGHEHAAIVAFEHHAGYDGRGYPTIPFHDHDHDHASHGPLHGDGLHLFSRLTAVVDAYDAITTRRAYRRAESPMRALHALLTGAGRSHDPDAVQAFIGMVGIYPPGSRLLLNDGRIVTVLHSNEVDGTRMKAAVVSNPDGSRLEPPGLIDLDQATVADQVSGFGSAEDVAALIDLLTVS